MFHEDILYLQNEYRYQTFQLQVNANPQISQ